MALGCRVSGEDSEKKGYTPPGNEPVNGTPENEDLKESRESKDGMSDWTDTGISFGIHAGPLENWKKILEDWKTTGLDQIYHRKKRRQENTEKIEEDRRQGSWTGQLLAVKREEWGSEWEK